MAKRKRNTVNIMLYSTGVRENGNPTGCTYVYSINQRNRTGKGKLELKKYDWVLRQHIIFKEKRITSSSN